ncbi:hypothetical protein GQ53DRAFT_741968 [Thozetella sp. PMI_491]|nr:hypothetical protein GQ53DRAFT_741968 [Thozetella sp. PMI_491]
MLSAGKTWLSVGLLVLGAQEAQAGAFPVRHENKSHIFSTTTTTCDPAQSEPSTHHVHTKYSTPVSHRTSLPSIVTTTVDVTTNVTICPTTPTPTPTPTPISSYDPCPTTCQISAGTVELFFWPTSADYVYPSTYVFTPLDYTFTSPSVYMLVNTMVGTNPLGAPIGPSATSTIYDLNLDEVSTIVPGSGETRQLTLNDLDTDCPQTAEPSVIATMIPGGRCDPVLAAPDKVKSWASPCGACGNFGLFDPPYAIPTITGSLLPSSTVVSVTPTSAAASPTITVVSQTSQAASTTSPPVQTASASQTNVYTSCLILALFTALFLL